MDSPAAQPVSSDPPAVRPVRREESDEQLLARVAQARDAEALAELFQRHEDAAFGLAKRLCNSPALAEEALQEAFLRIWEAAASYRPVGRPRNWILAFVIRESLKQTRTSHRQKKRETLAAHFRACTAPEPRPLQAADGGELQAGLEHALRNLPLTQRRLVALHYGAGLNQAQISATLSINQRLVSRRLREALDQLRFELDRLGLLAAAGPDWEAWFAAQLTAPAPRDPGCSGRPGRGLNPVQDTAGTAQGRPRFNLSLRACWTALACLAPALSLSLLWTRDNPAQPTAQAMAQRPLGTAGEAIAPSAARGQETVHEDEFDRPELNPFWSTAAPTARLRFHQTEVSWAAKPSTKEQPRRSSATVLGLQAQLPAPAPTAAFQETGIRSSLIDLQGWEAGRFELTSFSPKASGPAEYGVILYGQDDRILWHQGFRIEPSGGENGFLVREVCGNAEGPFASNFGLQRRQRLPGFCYDMKIPFASASRERAWDEAPAWFEYDDPKADRLAGSSAHTCGRVSGFRIYAYVKAFPGGSMEWSLDRCRFSRSK